MHNNPVPENAQGLAGRRIFSVCGDTDQRANFDKDPGLGVGLRSIDDRRIFFYRTFYYSSRVRLGWLIRPEPAPTSL